jgi:hypothetical protein
MKAIFGLTLLLLCCAQVHADGIAAFEVIESTYFGTIQLSSAPPADNVFWRLAGPINGAPQDDFPTDETLLFQLVGINLPTSGPQYRIIGQTECGFSGCAAWQEYIEYPTDLPPGITVYSTVEIPTQTPEPASLVLLGSGLIGIGALRKRRNASQRARTK